MANSDRYILPKGESPEGRGGGGSEIRFNWSKNSGGLKKKRGKRRKKKSEEQDVVASQNLDFFVPPPPLFPTYCIHLRASEAIAVLHGNKSLLLLTLIL